MLVIAFFSYAAHVLYLWEWEFREGYLHLVVVSGLLALIVFSAFKLYKPWRGYSYLDMVANITAAWFMVVLGVLAYLFFTKTGHEFSRGWLGLWALLGWLGLVASRMTIRSALRWLRGSGYNLRHIVLVGSGRSVNRIVQQLKNAAWSGFAVSAVFLLEDGAESAAPNLSDCKAHHGIDNLAEYLSANPIEQVWVSLPLRDEETLEEILFRLRHATVDIRYLPDLFGFRLLTHTVSEIAGMPMIDISTTPMIGVNRLIKAIEDKFLASVILVLISPLLVLLAVGVKLNSPGPIIYRQERVGWNGNTFMMYKFRSMPVDIESSGVEWGNAKAKTPTRFGAFLRRSSLDELPQFFNVLKGDMSIVGPRPERSVFVERFKDEIPGYMKKHMVKAGITGWAQINGWRGDTDLGKRIEYDLYYIENWSVWLDLKIIVLTLFKGFINKNAY